MPAPQSWEAVALAVNFVSEYLVSTARLGPFWVCTSFRQSVQGQVALVVEAVAGTEGCKAPAGLRSGAALEEPLAVQNTGGEGRPPWRPYLVRCPLAF